MAQTLDGSSGIHISPATGIQRVKLPTFASYSGTGNNSQDMDHPMREISFSNDSTANITLTLTTTLGTIPLVVMAGEVFDDRFSEFNNVQVSTTGANAWQYIVRSGRVF